MLSFFLGWLLSQVLYSSFLSLGILIYFLNNLKVFFASNDYRQCLLVKVSLHE